MEYLQQEFDLTPDETIEVILDHAANVQLMDPSNFAAYQQGRPYRYVGGYATQSPFRLSVPQTGHWHLVIDLGGGPGAVRATARVLPSAAIV